MRNESESWGFPVLAWSPVLESRGCFLLLEYFFVKFQSTFTESLADCGAFSIYDIDGESTGLVGRFTLTDLNAKLLSLSHGTYKMWIN